MVSNSFTVPKDGTYAIVLSGAYFSGGLNSKEFGYKVDGVYTKVGTTSADGIAGYSGETFGITILQLSKGNVITSYNCALNIIYNS